MQELALGTNVFNKSVLMTAATCGDIEFFGAVVTCLKEHLSTEQVRVNKPFRGVALRTFEVMGG